MGLEQIFAKKIEQQTEESDKNKDKSLREMMKDSELWGAVTATLEKNNKEDLAEKIVSGGELSEVEQNELVEVRKEALESVNKSSEILGALKDGELIKDIAVISPELDRLIKLIGAENIAKLFTKDYLIKLSFDDPSTFEDLRKKVESYSKINEEVKKIDENLQEFSKEFDIPVGELEELFQITDKGKRSEKVKEIVKNHLSRVKLWSKRHVVDIKQRKDARSGIDSLLKRYEDIFDESNKRMREVGRNLHGLSTGNSEMDKKISVLISGENIARDVEKNMSFSETVGVVNRRKEIQEEFEKFKNEKAKEHGVSKKIKNFSWNSFSPKEKNDLANEFKKSNLTKGKKGFWNKILDKLVQLVY